MYRTDIASFFVYPDSGGTFTIVFVQGWLMIDRINLSKVAWPYSVPLVPKSE
jgi:hypothetical protein